MSGYQRIIYEKLDCAAVLTLNNPENQNRIGHSEVDELSDAVHQANNDPDVHAIILTGTGEYFCAGGRIDGFPNGYVLDQRVYADATVRFQQALYQSGKAIIAAVQGHAFAGGLTVVEGCDLAVAAKDAKFGLTELSHGNFPMIALAVNSKSIPKKRLFEMIYFCSPIDSETAEKWNLINKVVPAGEVMDAAMGYARMIARRSPVAIRYGRQTYAEMMDLPLNQAMAHAKNAMVGMLATEDVRESAIAKNEGRDPRWIGK
ncbi:MAG: enoyl-CoA hydratase/isomerase family protein [Planctomycetota bacterium]|nr:enoyl-CoA hydratase/isomerase family protein [Planctomycetota bacterium]